MDGDGTGRQDGITTIECVLRLEEEGREVKILVLMERIRTYIGTLRDAVGRDGHTCLSRDTRREVLWWCVLYESVSWMVCGCLWWCVLDESVSWMVCGCLWWCVLYESVSCMVCGCCSVDSIVTPGRKGSTARKEGRESRFESWARQVRTMCIHRHPSTLSDTHLRSTTFTSILHHPIPSAPWNVSVGYTYIRILPTINTPIHLSLRKSVIGSL